MVLRHSKISTSAFTLVELLVVIAIIGILSTLSVVALNSARSKARDARRLSDVKQIGMALEMYLDTKGVYPETPVLSDNGVITGLCISDLGISSTCGADVYLQKIPAGPKKNENYTYFSLHNQSDYRVNFELENNSGGFTAGPLSYSPSGLVRDLIGWWKFDETSGNIAYDSSGYNNHGNLFGGPAHAPGRINNALSFDGTDDYVQLPNLGSFSSFTIEGWLKAIGDSLIGSTGYNTFVGSPGYYNRLLYSTGGKMLAQMGAGSHPSTNIAPRGQWNHIVYVYNSQTNIAKWYINGNPDSEFSGAIPFNQPTKIGAYDLANYMFNGLIDEVRIYNRALSAEEVLALFQDL